MAARSVILSPDLRPLLLKIPLKNDWVYTVYTETYGEHSSIEHTNKNFFFTFLWFW